jgi:hypothetical protein
MSELPLERFDFVFRRVWSGHPGHLPSSLASGHTGHFRLLYAEQRKTLIRI